jgi:hypothetical protein
MAKRSLRGGGEKAEQGEGSMESTGRSPAPARRGLRWRDMPMPIFMLVVDRRAGA